LFADAVAKIGTERIRFHKAVLAAHAEGLAMFLAKQGDEVFLCLFKIIFSVLVRVLVRVCVCVRLLVPAPGSVPVPCLMCRQVLFPAISPEAFRSALRYIYYGETRIQPLPACELISFCKVHLRCVHVLL
jgi:hypothetical protein